MDKIQLILLSILAGLIIIVVVYYLQNFEVKTGKTSTFIIIGHNNSGKTSLYLRLTKPEQAIEAQKQKKSATVSSLEVNKGSIQLPISNESIQKNYELIDYPGYVKYDNLFNNLLSTINLKGVMFMVDSDMMSFQKNLNLTARKLFKILTVTETLPIGKDYLVMVNKVDLFNSLPVNKIKTLLQQEVNQIIEFELKNNEDELSFWHEYLPFSFDKLKGNVDFKTGSVMKNNISEWENWLDEKVVNPT